VPSTTAITGRPVSSRRSTSRFFSWRRRRTGRCPCRRCRPTARAACARGDADRLDDRVDRLLQRLADLVGVDDDGLGHAGHEVAALDLHGQRLLERVGVADLDLDALGGLLADQQVVLALHVLDDRLVHLVAADADDLRVDDAGEGDHGDLGGAAADVDDHVAPGSVIGRPAPIAAAMGSSIR
jgi:hypothetical protein